VTTLDRTKLTQKLGALPAGVLDALADGLKAAMDIE
jgi:hypothetical protein